MKRGSKSGYRYAYAALGLLLSTLSCAQVAAQVKSEVSAIDQDIRVVVKEGDILSSIVKQVMGSSEYWEEVAALNKIKTPDALKPGDLVIFPGSLVQKRNFARVVFTKGKVSLTSAADKATDVLQKGDKVYLGDVINTGKDGFVSLSFKGDTLANIQPVSRIQVVEFDCFDTEKSCVVNLSAAAGQMDFDVRNVGFKEPTSFSVDTPNVSAAVRGTKIDVEVTDGSAVGVTSGEIEVSSNGVSNTVPVGKGTLAGEGRSVSTLFNLLKEPEYNEFTRLSSEDYLAWSSIEDAKSYKVVLATSESMTDIIDSMSTTDTYTALLPEPQSFYLSTRALDENGLKGFKAIQKIDQVEIDDSVEAPLLEIELSERELKIVNAGDLGSEVHIGNQLQTIDDFDHLIRYEAHDIPPGETLELDVDPDKDIFISSRAVVSASVVSPYGNIYEFKGRQN